MRHIKRVCGAVLVSLALAAPAQAVPDVPLEVYLDHVAPLELEWPAAGTLTDGFGQRWGRPHRGIDIGILSSPDVVAADSGTVSAAGWLTGYEGYGLVVIVESGGGYSQLYAHLSATNVLLGQWVEAGDLLGAAGCTGSCTGTHLHFEHRLHGVSLDPLPFLP